MIPSIFKETKGAAKGMGKAWKDMLTGAEDVDPKVLQRKEDVKLLGMLEEKVKAERGPELPKGMEALMSMMNTWFPAEGLRRFEEPVPTMAGAGNQMTQALSEYVGSEVSPGRMQAATMPMPQDPRLMALAGMLR